MSERTLYILRLLPTPGTYQTAAGDTNVKVLFNLFKIPDFFECDTHAQQFYGSFFFFSPALSVVNVYEQFFTGFVRISNKHLSSADVFSRPTVEGLVLWWTCSLSLTLLYAPPDGIYRYFVKRFSSRTTLSLSSCNRYIVKFYSLIHAKIQKLT